MQNSFQQARNLDGAFVVEPWTGMVGPILVLDDMVDSTWTFTVLCALLRLLRPVKSAFGEDGFHFSLSDLVKDFCRLNSPAR